MLTEIEKKWLLTSLAIACGICVALLFNRYSSFYVPMAILAVFALLFRLGLRKSYWTFSAFFFAAAAWTLHSQEIRADLKALDPWALQERRKFKAENERESEFVRDVKNIVGERLILGLEHDERMGNLARSIVLGEKSAMSIADKKVFVEAGTLHAFAVSGLHVGVIALTCEFILLIFCIPFRWATILSIPLMWLYIYVVGMGASALRSGVMMSSLLFACGVFRRYNFISAWSIAFIVFHILMPTKLFSVGSSLSFAITLAIILYLKLSDGARGWKSALALSFVIWAASTPIMAYHFGRFTPGGMIANFVVVPLAAIAVVSLALGLIIGLVCPYVAIHLNNFAALALSGLAESSRVVALLPGASLEIKPWSLTTVIAWYVALILFLGLIASIRKHKKGIIHI